jgi:hypothetical protein
VDDGPGLYNLEIKQGKRYVRPIVWQPGEQDYDEITGWTAKLTIRQPGTGKVLLVLDTSSAGADTLSIGAPHFTVTLTISTATTRTFDFDAAEYDLDLFDPYGEGYPFLTGQVYVTEDLNS